MQRDMSAQTPLSTAPTVNVQSSFVGGGSTTQQINDHQDHFEVQNYTSIAAQEATSSVSAAASAPPATLSTPTPVRTKPLPIAASSLPDCQPDSNNVVSSYQAGQAAQYSYTDVVHGSTQATLADLGVYAEDDWKPITNLTFSYGFRYETQNYMSDHHDFAPRLSFAWGVGNKSSPQTVIRGGFGIFYERSALTNVVTTRQQNGTNFLSTIVSDPGSNCSPSNPSACSPCNPTTVSSCTGATLGGLQTYSLRSQLPHSLPHTELPRRRRADRQARHSLPQLREHPRRARVQQRRREPDQSHARESSTESLSPTPTASSPRACSIRASSASTLASTTAAASRCGATTSSTSPTPTPPVRATSQPSPATCAPTTAAPALISATVFTPAAASPSRTSSPSRPSWSQAPASPSTSTPARTSTATVSSTTIAPPMPPPPRSTRSRPSTASST